jgi:hypothetical protein
MTFSARGIFSSFQRPAFVRKALVSSATAIAGITLIIACIPDPKGDYEDFTANPKNVKAAPITQSSSSSSGLTEQPDAAPLDVAPGGKKSTYLAVCYPSVAGGDLSKTLRFIADVEVKGGANGNTLQLTLNPLNGTSRAFNRADIVGAPIILKEAGLTGSGIFTLSVPSADILGPANTFSGRDITVKDLELQGRYAEKKFCSGFAGDIIRPITSPFSAGCLYFAEEDAKTFGPSADRLSFSVQDVVLRGGDPMVNPLGDFECK